MPDYPYEEHEDAYREEAERRYERLKKDAGDVITESDQPLGTAGFAGIAGTWVYAKTREHNLRPQSTLPTSTDEYEWFDRYARRSYDEGQQFARRAMEARGIDPPRTPGVDQSPRHRHALTEVHERQRRYWGRLATDLSDDVKVTLRELPEGASISQARAALHDRIEKKGLYRAGLIAGTEPNWAFNRAILEEYADAGIENVDIDVTWETAGDNKVCERCALRSGTYSVDQAREMMEEGDFPEHSLCRCVFLPSASA